MKKGIITTMQLSSHVLTSWKAVLEYLNRPTFNSAFYKEVRVIRKNETWEIQSLPANSDKAKPKVLNNKCRGVGLFDLNW